MLTIRFATADDAATIHAAILGIGRAMHAEAKIKSTVEDIRRHGFGDHPAFETLIAEIDGVFAGLCLFFPSFSTWNGKPGTYIQDLFVEEVFRGKGVGEALLARLAALTRERGGAYIRLSVDVDNVTAQRFYERIGMEWRQDERIYTARGEAFARLADAE